MDVRERPLPGRTAQPRPLTPVTVAVVSFNTRDLLRGCLASLAPDAEAGRAEVWVVDNGSTDGSVAAVREHAPWANVVKAERNLGFGRAVNLVARRTDGDWLLALNADTELAPGAIAALVAAGESHPRIGAVVPRLRLPDGSTQHSAHPFPTVRLTLAFNLGLNRLAPGWAGRRCLPGAWDPDQARDVPWALGACQLLRRATFLALGGFDEHQWMYAEDLELGWRLAERGYRTRYEPGATVLHHAGAATAVAFGARRHELFMTATYELLRRRRGPLRTWLTAALNIAGAAARVIATAPLALVSARGRAAAGEHLTWLRAHIGAARASARK